MRFRADIHTRCVLEKDVVEDEDRGAALFQNGAHLRNTIQKASHQTECRLIAFYRVWCRRELTMK